MTENAWQAQLTSTFTPASLLSALILRTPYVVIGADTFTDLDLQTSEVVVFEGKLFLYDSADASTAHDGVSTLVDTNGRRYKIVGSVPYPDSVLSRLGTPPGSPNIGDTYMITTGTGAWAGQDDDLTTYTAQGWLFITPKIGRPILVEDEDSFYFWDEGGSWNVGFGQNSVAADSVTPIEQDHIGIPTVIAILNTPPGSPTEGQRWLVGTSPTGAWVGSNNKLATWRSGAWVYTSPHNGAKIYDLNTGAEYGYESSAWALTTEAPVDAQVVYSYDFAVSGHATTIDVTSLGSYLVLEVDFVGLDTATVAATIDIALRTSTDDGSSFASTGYVGPQTFSGASILVADDELYDSGFYTRVRIGGWNTASHKSIFSSPDLGTLGVRNTAEANNALRILLTPAAGTISAGQIVVTGYRG